MSVATPLSHQLSSLNGTDTSSTTNTASSTNTSPISITASSTNSILPPSNTTAALNGTSTHTAKSYKPAQVAGISIGTAIAACFITILSLWFLQMVRWRKNNNHKEDSFGSRSSRYPLSRMDTRKIDDDEAASGKANVRPRATTTSIDTALEQSLLEEIPEQDIKEEMLALDTLIEQHVDNNYQSGAAKNNFLEMKSLLEDCGYSKQSNTSAKQLDALLTDPISRHAAIRHLVAWILFSSITLESGLEMSLLPEQVTRFLIAMPEVESTPGSTEAFQQALSKWRSISAYLLQPKRNNRGVLQPTITNLSTQTDNILTKINNVLSPYIAKGTQERQRDNLKEIIAEAAKFGHLLFSQPTTWLFDWSLPATKSRGNLIVFPGLVKVTDKDGRSYRDRKVVVSVETAGV